MLRWLLAVDTSPNALAISPHTMGIFSGRYLFMKYEAHCRGLRYRPRMLWLRIMQACGLGVGGGVGVGGGCLRVVK